MSRRQDMDAAHDEAGATRKKPWLAPKAEAQPVKDITAGLTSGTADGVSGCHS